MKRRRGLPGEIVSLMLVVGLVTLPGRAHCQGTAAKTHDRERLIAVAREIMITARYCALITLSGNGQAQARTMDPFPPESGMAVWLATNPRSRKVAEIRRHSRVVLYYFDQPSQAYVSLTGTARLVIDPREKARHFKDEWKDFYPDREKGYLLIVVTPEKLEVVSVKQGITGDSVYWNPPTVRFKKN